MFLLFYRIKIYGTENLFQGSAILIANHNSHLDPLVVGICVPEEIHFLARDSLFRVPVLGFIMRRFRGHPIARNKGNRQAFKVVAGLLGKGKKVVLFPEGSRSEDGSIQDMKEGAAFFVYKMRCPVIPIHIAGTYQIWPKHRRTPKFFGKIICRIGKPILYDDLVAKKREHFLHELTKRMKKSLQTMASVEPE